MAKEFVLQPTIGGDYDAVESSNKLVPPLEGDPASAKRKCGQMTLMDAIWHTLGAIYMQKIEFLRAEAGGLHPDEALMTNLEYLTLQYRLAIANTVLMNAIFERYAKENVENGFSGFMIREDFSIWLRKSPRERLANRTVPQAGGKAKGDEKDYLQAYI